MGPNAQAYPTVSVKLVDMMNSGIFEADKPKRAGNNNKNKSKNKNKNKNKDIIPQVAFLKRNSDYYPYDVGAIIPQ